MPVSQGSLRHDVAYLRSTDCRRTNDSESEAGQLQWTGWVEHANQPSFGIPTWFWHVDP